MRIGFFHNFNSHRANTGYAVHVEQLSAALMRRGHSILTYYSCEKNPEFISYRRRKFLKFLKDVDAIYIRLSGNMENYTLLKLLRPFSLPVVWELNAPIGEARLRDNISEDKIKRAVKKRKRLAGLVDACISVAGEIKDYSLKELNIKNSFVVENGSNPELFSPEKRNPDIYGKYKDKFKVLWMGRVRSPWHGVDIILDVARRLNERDKDVVFIIIGDTKGIDLELPENVIAMGAIEYLNLAPYIASCDIGLSLYHDIRHINGYRFYGSSLKLFDYMASGLPVIASYFGQIKDVIKDDENGLLTDNNPDDIVQKILTLKGNPDHARSIGAAARQTVLDYYNWDRVAMQTEEILLSL